MFCNGTCHLPGQPRRRLTHPVRLSERSSSDSSTESLMTDRRIVGCVCSGQGVVHVAAWPSKKQKDPNVPSMWRVARETKRHEVWLATGLTQPERSDWTLDWARDQPCEISPPGPFDLPTSLICPQIDQPGSLHSTSLARSQKHAALAPESSVTAGPGQLRPRPSGVGSSPACCPCCRHRCAVD